MYLKCFAASSSAYPPLTGQGAALRSKGQTCDNTRTRENVPYKAASKKTEEFASNSLKAN